MTKKDKDAGTSLHRAAVKLGTRGGLRGGPARAEKLSGPRRTAIAKMGGKAKAKKSS
jgi:hypothetical protein